MSQILLPTILPTCTWHSMCIVCQSRIMKTKLFANFNDFAGKFFYHILECDDKFEMCPRLWRKIINMLYFKIYQIIRPINVILFWSLTIRSFMDYIGYQHLLQWFHLLLSARCCKLLIDHGSKVNSPDDQDWLPIHWAVVKGHTDCVRILSNKGANLSSTTKVSRRVIQSKCHKDEAWWLFSSS